MKTYKIDGESYELVDSVSEAPDAYSKKGKLLDDEPKGKCLGYVVMEDGSVIKCFKSFNPMIIIAPILVITVAAGGFFAFVSMQPKDFTIPGSEIFVKQGDDETIIKYNGFTSAVDGSLDINFENGAEECKIQISGEGIEDIETMVAPYSTCEFLPITVTTDEGLVVATMTLTTASSTVTNEIAIEIPENYTPNSAEGSLDGYWNGEYIYGITVPTE